MFNFTKHKRKKYFCFDCHQCFYSEVLRSKHRENCIEVNGTQAVKMPEKYIDKNGKERPRCVYFRNHHKQLPAPFVINADLECNLKKVSSCQQSDSKSYTEKYQKHISCAYGY